MRTNSVPAQGRAAAAPSETVQAASAQVAERRETVANRTVDLSTGSAAVSADESSAEVVEELLSENEKLRLIIQDLKEEVRRPFLGTPIFILQNVPMQYADTTVDRRVGRAEVW